MAYIVDTDLEGHPANSSRVETIKRFSDRREALFWVSMKNRRVEEGKFSLESTPWWDEDVDATLRFRSE